MAFFDRLRERVRATDGLLAVGLNPDLGRLPDDCREYEYPRRAFNRRIIDATHEDAAAYAVNPAFYADADGWTALAETVAYARGRGVPVVLDGKWSDLRAGQHRDLLDRADAVTVSPFYGRDALAPALDRDLGIFVTCRTPNAGASDLQDRELSEGEARGVGQEDEEDETPTLAESVAATVESWAAGSEGTENGTDESEADAGLLVGGPSETVEALRERAPGLPFLVVGGARNDPEVAGLAEPEIGETGDSGGGENAGIGLVAVSREVIYAGETARRGRESGMDAYASAARQSARRLKNQLNRHR